MYPPLFAVTSNECKFVIAEIDLALLIYNNFFADLLAALKT